MYYYWMQLAKITGSSLEEAVIRAKQWLEMEESYQQRKNPEPYYYLRSLYYLEAQEGSLQALAEAKRLDQEIDRMNSSDYFSRRRRNIEHIRDILIEGKGMAQMFDVSYCRTEDEIMREYQQKYPQYKNRVSALSENEFLCLQDADMAYFIFLKFLIKL